MRSAVLFGLVCLFAPFSINSAQASTLPVEGTFSILGGTAFSDPGLVVQTYPTVGTPGNLSFELQQGTQYAVPLFDIWTNETANNSDDLNTPGTLEVGFNFTQPDTSGQTIGTVVGEAHLFNTIQNGSLQWSGPLQVAYGGAEGGLISILLSDVTFNWGVFGLSSGPRYGATVSGTFSYDVAATPLPGAFLLLLTGLVSLIGLGYRRRRHRLAESAA